MASNSAKECPICQDEYDEEERCPRVLPCSHTLCSECLQNLIIRNSRTCPFCLRKFTARSARDVGVNTSLLDVLKVLREMEMKVPVPLETPAASKSTRMNDQRRETEEVINNLLGSLKTADDKIDRQLLSNTQLLTYFSEAEDSISNEIQPCINEVLSQNFTRASYVKEHSTRLKNQKMTIDETRKVVTEVKTKLKSAKTFTQIGTASDEVEKIKTDAESSLREFMEQLTEDEKIQLILEKVAKATKHEVTKLKDALNSMRRDDEISFIPEIQQMKISKDLKIHKSISQPVTIGNLRSRTGSVMELIGQRLVFAVQEFKGRSRYAEISLQAKDRICLHCLKEQSIPPNAYIFQHSDVLNLMDVSSRLVFLQLSSAEGITLGKLFIRLSPDSKRAQQFVLLCSGEKTVSYINSTILSVFGKGNKDEFVWMGDYDNMGGKGGRGLVQDVLNEERGVFSRPQKAGTIQGMYNFVRDEEASQFFIYTHESPDIIHDCCFGMVEDGLPILQEVLCRYTEVNKITVSDAGLVLPNKPKMANVARYEILRWIRNMK